MMAQSKNPVTVTIAHLAFRATFLAFMKRQIIAFTQQQFAPQANEMYLKILVQAVQDELNLMKKELNIP
jgi:NADH:ubiquinone oxidoreductase subunit H